MSNTFYKKIKGTRNYFVTEDGYIWKKKSDYGFKSIAINYNRTTGYGQSLVQLRNSKWVAIRVHQAVAEAFCKKPRYMRNLEVNHADGDKTNNHAENLLYTTHAENMRHAWAIGLCKKVAPAIRKKRAELNGRNTELTVADVKQIRRLRANGLKLRELGYLYNLHPVNICAICNRRTFKSID